MFLDKLVRDVLDVLLGDAVKYNHLHMVKYLSGDTDFEGVRIKMHNNYIFAKIPVYDNVTGYLTVSYTHNDSNCVFTLKNSKNEMIDREKIISILLYNLV